MSHLPRVSGQEVVAALTRIGFRVRRQHGSHIIVRRDTPIQTRWAATSLSSLCASETSAIGPDVAFSMPRVILDAI